MSRQLTFKSMKKPLSTEISETMGLFSNFSLMLTKSFVMTLGRVEVYLLKFCQYQKQKLATIQKKFF